MRLMLDEAMSAIKLEGFDEEFQQVIHAFGHSDDIQHSELTAETQELLKTAIVTILSAPQKGGCAVCTAYFIFETLYQLGYKRGLIQHLESEVS